MALKILVVDDEDSARMTLARLLEVHGYKVVEARDGVEAVQKALHEQPDVTLMDIAMPIMDGCQAAETLRANAKTAHMPIIACTGVTRPVDEWDSLFQAVVGKPFTAAAVIAQIQRVAGQPPSH